MNQPIATRDKVKTSDTWNLSHVFKSKKQWELEFGAIEKDLPGYAAHRKTLGTSADALKKCLDFDTDIERRMERLGSFAFLRHSEDITNTTNQDMVARYSNLATRAGEAASYIIPKVLAIPAARMTVYLASPSLAAYRNLLTRILRSKKHVLSQKEERLLAMQGEIASSAGTIFRQINDADFKFGSVNTPDGRMELTHGTWGTFLEMPHRPARRSAFQRMFAKYEEFENTLASTYNASVLQDVYSARVRRFRSAREQSLFNDNVPVAVYDRLIETIHDHMATNHRYLALHRRKLGVKALHFYDTYVPLVQSVRWNMGYEKAAATIVDAMAPLGKNYCNTLARGLTRARWVDRYENKGKRSGAFSAGGYDVPPYILMNYKSNSLQGIYTLAHEAGHSMHTWYSAANQQFVDYDYPIFVAEVASTFNEQLLTHHLLNNSRNRAMKAFIVDREINQIRSTVIRQTMFAEFEKISHQVVEDKESLTKERLRQEYRKLLVRYFGEDFVIDDQLTMEWARIPHFYSAFYVYKYATGLAAAMALSERVRNGGKQERDAYLGFLKSGASKFPLELLAEAGADLNTPAPVEMVMARFDSLIDELESLI